MARSKILFLGAGALGVPSLRTLTADERFEIVAIVTQPDRPVGRHATLTPPPIKSVAQELGIKTILQPETLKDDAFREQITTLSTSCDAFLVISYGKILPQWILDLPAHGIINLHPSLLPRWRGTSPIQAAIAAGDAETGVTIMNIDAEMDHGPIVNVVTTNIGADETGGGLHDRLAELGASILPQTLADYLAGRITPREQDHASATFCGILSRDNGKIDWTQPADAIARLVRAYDPWPGTWTMIDGKRLKILKAHVKTNDTADTCPVMPCGDGTWLVLDRVQLEGSAAMTGEDFLKGHAKFLLS
jgi:methionyl-tRNA formyltransferase